MKINRVLAALATATVLGGRAVIGTVGDASTANDILGFLSPEAKAVVMSDATWTAIAIAAFLWLAYELHRDAGKGQKAFDEAKQALTRAQASNDKAWAFEPEFRDKMDAITAALKDVAATRRVIEQTLERVEALHDKQETQRKFLSSLRGYIDLTTLQPINAQRIMHNMRAEMRGYARGLGVNHSPDGREWLSYTAHGVAEEFLPRHASLAGLDPNAIKSAPVPQSFQDSIIQELGDHATGKASQILSMHITYMFWYHQLYEHIEKRAWQDFTVLRSIDLHQSPEDIGSEKPL